MEPGKIVEYIDQQKVIVALITENKKERLRLLTESNREVNLSVKRLVHISENRMDLSISRDNQVKILKELANHRLKLADSINLEELWELLEGEDWQDLETMASLCFSDEDSSNAASAVIRSILNDRLYFKFDTNRFLPNSEEQVILLKRQQEEARIEKEFTESAVKWLQDSLEQEKPELSEELKPAAKLIMDYLIHEEEAPKLELTRKLLKEAKISSKDKLFMLFVRLGIWDIDENLLLKQYNIETEFDDKQIEEVLRLKREYRDFKEDKKRRDLRESRLITIDGPATLDFDDAISIEAMEDHHIIGVHIIDLAHFIPKDSLLDKCARERASSIYMPDARFPMLPLDISEDICSLKEREIRPAISILMKVADYARVVDYEIVPSIIEVKEQLSYSDANRMIEEDGDLANLDKIARNFRSQRLMAGAIQISLPEINIRLDEESREILITKIDRESSSRILVSEIMIMANAMMADFLKKNEMPAIFRSQAEAKNRLYKGNEGSLFQNLMQRRHLNRVVLSSYPETHSGTGFPCYLTATSPIRKYSDLVNQRQIKAVFNMEEERDREEVERLLSSLEQPGSNIGRVQALRKRYWLLKYLEKRVGQHEKAMVLEERRNQYQILLLDYMLECMLPVSPGIQLKPESEIEVVIQQVNARRDQLSLYLN